MSGLLQRLAGQALGGQGGGTKDARVRPAMGVHAQVPVAMSQQPQMATPIPDAEDSLTTELSSFTPGEETPLMPAKRVPATSAEHVHAPTQGSPRIFGQSEPIADVSAVKASMPTPHAFAVSPSRMPEFARRREPGPPPRLLEEVAPTPLPPSAIAPARAATWLPPRRDESTASAETTEVHVHIGRIDVTTVQEPAPTKRRLPARNQTLPLSDYLARRRPS